MHHHQAAIRRPEFEPLSGRGGRGDGDRAANTITTAGNFLRYGYGDYLKGTLQYGIVLSVWPGTQRRLL
jgi:hypothetical protein